MSSSGVTESTAGCATAMLPSGATWIATTGTFTTAARASSTTCPRSLGPVGATSSGYADSNVELAVPIAFATSGAHSVVLNWDVLAGASASLALGGCTGPSGNTTRYYCVVNAGWSVSVGEYLLDSTNGSITFGLGWAAYNFSYIEWFWSSGSPYYVNGSSVGLHLGTFATYANATGLNRSHSYVLVIGIDVASYAEIETFETTSARASSSATVSLVHGGHKATLTSILVL